MATLTKRVGLGRPLTYQEADDNFEFSEEQADLAEGFALDAQGSAIAAQNAADSVQDSIDDAVEQYEFAVEDNANRIRNLEYGDGPYPSLDLLFTGAKSVDPRLVVERPSPKWVFNERGILVEVPPNMPAIDYDPVTGKSLGLLVEGQATNLLLGSDSPATQAVVVTATAMTLSFIGTGTITLSGAYTGALVGTGDERVTLTFTPSAGSLTLTVSGNVEFAQLEEGSTPTSYVPTEGSQVTRAVDSAFIPATDFPYNPNEGTFVVEVDAASLRIRTDGFATSILSLSTGSRSGGALVLYSFGVQRESLRFSSYVASTVTATATLASAISSITEGTVKIAISYRAADNTIKLSALGGTSSAVASEAPSISTEEGVVMLARLGALNEPIFTPKTMSFRQVSYFPRALSDSELQALTS